MTPPIICHEADGGEVLIFRAAVDMVTFLEPIDAEDPRDVFFDGDGRLLRIACDKVNGIKLHATETEPNHREQLHDVLIKYFVRLGYANESLTAMSHEELIQIAWRHTWR